MSAVLSRDQADLLAAYGTWQVAWMLTSPDTGIPHVKGMAGGALGAAWSWRTDGTGITARRGRHADPAGDPEVVITWAQIRAAAKALPEHLKADLARARRRTQREWLRHCPEFAPQAPGGREAWCAPPRTWHREAQDAERRTLAACLDALVLDNPRGVPGQLDLFGGLS
jgi:hypothetical protein